ncbi:MAG: arsenite methyltransferase [Spirochaetaceae bacterium]|nr:arsenite methyltransferase [Spirochaetaceae bacterium]
MENELKLKEIVRKKYGKIVSKNNKSCCCKNPESIMSENYNDLNGYNPDADYGLGCGLPTKFAKIKKGDTVVDLGSGAGNDCFVARAEVGETGKVIGIDFTPEMLEKARQNVKKRRFTNVEFIQGDIDNLPLESNLADVIVSNCVLNLVPNKQAVFKEIYRVLKPNGHFSISDIVLTGELPEKIRSMASMYAGCVSGAVTKDIYLKCIQEAGFKNIIIQKEKNIEISDEELKNHLTEKEIANCKKDLDIIKSITVYAEK